MIKKITEGVYGKFGASRQGDAICFTFEGEKEQECAVRIYDKHPKKGHAGYRDIPVPKDACVGAVRSVCVYGLNPAHCDYNYVIDGAVEVDPYAARIVGREKWADFRRFASETEVRSGFELSAFDWDGDHQPEIPRTDMVMYKLHVRGFTKDSGAEVAHKGTFAGIIEKIEYLKALGVTTLELMPIYEFEELTAPVSADGQMDFAGWSPQAVAGYQLMQQMNEEDTPKQPGINYWGYGKGNYFAPKASYASGADACSEFKSLVRALHTAGMECVLEMQFDGQVNPNYVVEALRHWVLNYHVDGFHLHAPEHVISSAVHDVLLRRSKIFAASFPSELWELPGSFQHLYVYNDDFLYTARKLINHQDGNLIEFFNQQRKQHAQIGFVNYFANNNGFTLADVFSYADKHNEANGEDGMDGNDWNYSVNCGVEGVTRKKSVQQQRLSLMKQAAAAVILAQGVPLLLAGDEFGNSQRGNNNAYCQDNRIGWVNWKQLARNEEFFSYVKDLLALRKAHPCIRSHRPMQMQDYEAHGLPDLSYHGSQAWSGEVYPSMQALGAAYCGAYAGEAMDVYLAWNFSQGRQVLALPKTREGRQWRLIFGKGRLLEEKEQIELITSGVTMLVTELKKEKPVKKTGRKKAHSAPKKQSPLKSRKETDL